MPKVVIKPRQPARTNLLQPPKGGTKPPLLHLPLEQYKARYTEWLADVERAAFASFDYVPVWPAQDATVLDIANGRLLDTINRPLFSMAQVARLLEMSGPDLWTLYMSDFFTPGLDALAYSGKSFQAFSFMWAQTFDRYDFTTDMVEWMRPWELMAFQIYRGIFVACDGLADLVQSAFPGAQGKVHVVGLPFDSAHVKTLLAPQNIKGEEFDVVYSSRFDQEKMPGMFLDLVAACPGVKFVICTGHNELRGTDDESVRRARHMAGERHTNLFLREGLSKSEYYGILHRAKVQFNCALQDWVSFTLLEALTFKCAPLYPAHRSFPETLLHDRRYLYRPFDVADAQAALSELLANPARLDTNTQLEVLNYHDGALGRIAQTIMSHV